MIVYRLNNLILIGTAHVSPASIKMVRETILKERPEIVGVELCPERYAALLRKSQSIPHSPIALTLYFIQELFSKRMGVEAGEEMLEAVRAANEIGAKIEFLDRNLSLTLEKLSKLQVTEKLKFLAWLITGFIFSPKVDISKFDENKIIELLQLFQRRCPGFYRVLVQERDEYIGNKILELWGGRKMVCVIGAGHVPGVVHMLKETWSFKTEWDMHFYSS